MAMGMATQFTGKTVGGPVDKAKSEKRMVAGRTRVVFDKPVYSPLLFKLDMKCAPWIKTMATDGRSLMFNPAFALELSVEHLMFAILHETMHCAFRHPSRRGHRDPEIWNIAGDISINNVLIHEEKIQHPSWVFHDKKYMGQSTEQIYDDLIKDKDGAKQKYKVVCPCVQKDPTAGEGEGDVKGEKDGKDKGDKGEGKGKEKGDQGGGSGGCDPIVDGRGWSDVEWSTDVEEGWKQAVIAAQQYAKMRGTAPGWLNQLVDDIVEPPVPIERIVQYIVGSYPSNDTTWRNPNRRYVSRGLHLPRQLNDKKNGVMVIDTSGSVDDETCKHFLGIALRALRSKGINQLRVIQCDATVVSDDVIKNAAEFKLYVRKVGLKGRGGTSFKPPFEKIAERGQTWDISFLVYLTDLCGDFPEHSPRYPVFWISTTENVAPFGRTYFWDQQGNKVVPMKKPSAN